PFSFDRIALHRAPGPELKVAAQVAAERAIPGGTLRADLVVRDSAGIVAELAGIALRPARSIPEGTFYAVAWAALPPRTALPAPRALAETLGPRLPALAEQHGLAAYDAAMPAVDAAASAWIAAALTTLGWRPEPGERVETAALAARLGLAAHLNGLLARYLAILAEDGVLRPDGSVWIVQHPPAPPDAMAATEAAIAAHPASAARLQLMASCGPNLPAILRGARNPVDDLFPGGDSAL
ncbi:MAG: hypothetical protein AAFV49_23235, partial [Pseudomonadota bacterium]